MPKAATEGGFSTPSSEVWGNVTALVAVKGGHCSSLRCDSCEKTFSGGVARILDHYARCNATPQHTRDWAAQQISKIDARRKGKESVKKMETVFNDIEEDETQRKIDSCLNKTGAKTELCNLAVAEWVYLTMQSFLITGDESFVEMVTTLIKHAPPGWKPPKPHLIRGKYLDKAYAKTKADCKELFKDMENMTALTIMSDGKTNNGRIPIVNYIAASPKGTHFLAADDMSNVAKDNVKMAKYLHEKCIETGFERSFYACVLDGALRSAFPHIEAHMPWISCIWCSCHIISLFFKDCFKLAVLNDALEKVKRVIKFIRDRQKPLAFFRSNSAKNLILPGSVLS
jgi:hypothetical protein